LIPIRTQGASRNRVSRINEEVLYNNLMKEYRFSGMNAKPNFYLDDKAMIVPSTLQNLFISLSGHYLQKIGEIKANDSTMAIPGNKEKLDEYTTKIKALMARCQKEIPENVLTTKGEIKYNIAMIYHEIGDTKNAEKNLDELYELSRKDVTYFVKFTGNKKSQYMMELTRDAYDYMERCANTAKEWKSTNLANKYEKINKELMTAVNSFFSMD